MSKTELTKEIEKALIAKILSGNFKTAYGALEVPCGEWFGKGKQNIDFATYAPLKQEITCYEIKITLSDLNSSASLSFIGNKNYLVLPYKLAKRVISIWKDQDLDEAQKQIKHIRDIINSRAGIIAYMPGNYKDYCQDSVALKDYQKAVGHLAVLVRCHHNDIHFADKVAIMEGILRAGCRDATKGYLDGKYL